MVSVNVSDVSNKKIHVDIITPDKTIFCDAVSMVVLPGTEGDFGVLSRHCPFSSTLRAGSIRLFLEGEPTHQFTIDGGVAQITPEKCVILATTLAGE